MGFRRDFPLSAPNMGSFLRISASSLLFTRCLSSTSVLSAPTKVVKGKTPSSTRWLKRQNKDPLVSQAVLDQYRSRSAYKIIELDDKYHFFKDGIIVIDCGARPGSWSQVAARRVGTDKLSKMGLESWEHGMVLAIDIEAMADLPGVVVMDRSDLTCAKVQDRIRLFMEDRKADVIMSDMAPNASGIHDMDHQRIMELCRSAYSLAKDFLVEGGVFLCKVWQGSLTNSFKSELKEHFGTVRECRLKSTRKESSEVYIFADGYNLK